MQPEEMLIEAAFPALPPRGGWAFDEVARQHGNYALCGAAAIVALTDEGAVESARLVFLSVGEGPVEAAQAAALLDGERPTSEAIRAASETAATQDIDPVGDIHAGACVPPPSCSSSCQACTDKGSRESHRRLQAIEKGPSF